MNRFDIILGKEPPKKEFPKLPKESSMTVSSQAFRELIKKQNLLSWEQVTQMAIDEAERRRAIDTLEFERQRQALNQTPLLTRFANMNEV